MRFGKNPLALLAVAGCLYVAAPAFASHDYQVTGQVLEVNDHTIVVQKGEERWEIDRTADTKIVGNLKVGERVTVHYHMVADAADVKKAKDAAKDKDADGK